MGGTQRLLFQGERFTQWLAYHKLNPRVWTLFRDLSREAWRSGQRLGARCIWENIRWRLHVAEKPADDAFVMNDHHVPYYARLVMLRHPDMDGYFERRDARFDIDDATLLREANAIDS